MYLLINYDKLLRMHVLVPLGTGIEVTGFYGILTGGLCLSKL